MDDDSVKRSPERAGLRLEKWVRQKRNKTKSLSHLKMKQSSNLDHCQNASPEMLVLETQGPWNGWQASSGKKKKKFLIGVNSFDPKLLGSLAKLGGAGMASSGASNEMWHSVSLKECKYTCHYFLFNFFFREVGRSRGRGRKRNLSRLHTLHGARCLARSHAPEIMS